MNGSEAMPIFNFRMDAETKRKLETLAHSTERDMSAYLRWMIRREYEARYRAIASPATVETETSTPVVYNPVSEQS